MVSKTRIKQHLRKFFLLILRNLGAKVWKRVSKTPVKRIFFSKVWKTWKIKLTKSVGIQEEYVFSTFTHFSKTFWACKSLKVFQVFICGKRSKIDYQCWYITKVSSTLLKSKMWKMWKVANINGFLSLKMWKKMCKRKKWYGIQ